MDPGTGIAIAGGIGALSSIFGGSSANKGAKEQAEAMREYNQILRDMLAQQESISKPFREALYPELQKALGIKEYKTPAVTEQYWVSDSSYDPITGWGEDTGAGHWETKVITPEQTDYRQIEGYDPTKAMAELPAYAAARNPLEGQYGIAKENILSSTPTGATGALARQLSGLETARAESVGAIPYNLYSGLYNTAMGLAAGKPELAIGAVNQMQQGAGSLMNYYGQQYGANMQNLGAIGQGLGYSLFNSYMSPGGGGGTTTYNPFMNNNNYYHPTLQPSYSSGWS